MSARKFVSDPTGHASSGTSLKGTFTGWSLSELTGVFGKPLASGDGYKVTKEWCLVFDDFTVATIYDWKQSDLYDSELPSVKWLEAEDYEGTEWHIGGTSYKAVEYVKAVLAAAQPASDPNSLRYSGEDL